ncbi:PTS system IIC component, Gat family [Seinonella peptonophila]|uniref:PTS system IIC component, Gat family n=1 Tax=Seinonella peptonophila TaxID=112248 RepID=A0A1M4V647_9BACL|nr:PTS transporter subunit IIC [Seinonella peptonophila]SHE64456.1 PTS system IIC component, Gat family [Seinonella peptonophila]
MDIILKAFNYISDLGATVMMPIIILIIGLLFQLSFSKALKAGVTVGVGFIGLNLVLSLIWDSVGPVTKILVDKFHLKLSVVDAGWPAAAGLAFATKVGAVIIPFIIVVNLLMLVSKQTKTVDIDIWNYWHFAFTGAIVMTLTDSLVFGLIAAAAHCIVTLRLADISAEKVQKEIGIPGISIAHGSAVTAIPITLLLDKLYDLIPGLKHSDKKSSSLQQKLGILGEPMIIGLLLGVILGIIVQYDFKKTGELAISMGALMLLLPRMVKVIMEGLIPISEGAKDFMSKRFKGSEFYIGLDSAVTLGHPTTITVSILLIPITLILAMIVPMNTTLPFGDLAATAFFVALVTPLHRGHLIRTLITGTVIMAIVLMVASYFGPMITETAVNTGFKFPEGASKITALTGGNWLAFIISQVLNWKWIGALLLAILTGGFLFFTRKTKLKA